MTYLNEINETTVTGSQVTYTCDSSHLPSSSEALVSTCQIDGTWNSSVVCQPGLLKFKGSQFITYLKWLNILYSFLDCGEITSIGNGSIVVRETFEVESRTLQKKVHYQCDPGFQLFPSKTITTKTCESNAEWAPSTEISCIPGKIHNMCLTGVI